MTTQILARPTALLSHRSRRELVEILVRAHRVGDKALVCQCQTELDRQTRLQAGNPWKMAASR